MLDAGKETIGILLYMMDQTWLWVIYGASIAFILFFSSNRVAKDYGKGFLFASLVIFNPIFAGVVVTTIFGTLRYYRFFWILFVYFAIAIAFSEICGKRGPICLLLCCGFIFLTGDIIYENNFETADNMFKVPQGAVEVCHYLQNVEEYPNSEMRISVDPELSSYIRQVDANIKLQYGRDAGAYSESQKGKLVFNLLDTASEMMGKESTKILTDALRTDSCLYAVIKVGKVNGEDMESYGYKYLDTVDKYEIYKLNEI